MGNHKPRIKTGRYYQFPRVNKLCPICESNQTESNQILRNKFYIKKNISFRL